MSIATIYRPAKTAMQSGKARTKKWLLVYRSEDKVIDNVMGWTGSSDMKSQEVRLSFNTQEEAEGYAKRENIDYKIVEDRSCKTSKCKPYVNNYK